MSQFAFLQREWSAADGAAVRFEVAAHVDTRTACFYVKRTLKLGDVVVLSILLAGFTRYLSDRLDASVV
ncbi:MAG: hypothetical protein GEV05_30600 [Betaproteobacteria bacterium]|nr:hypothetical protein [Betaproteobacteria bacterium]